MKIDTYTKIVLTVIALNLSFLTLKNFEFIPKAHANEPASITPSFNGTNYGLVPLNEDGSISVRLKNHNLEVTLSDITTDKNLSVNIESAAIGSLKKAGPIKFEK